ncbi:MAG: zf-HC2 domain-containing protein [Phycisphaerales bacterium]
MSSIDPSTAGAGAAGSPPGPDAPPARRPRGCRRASELASDRLDRRLTPSERLSLRVHLFICRYCRRFDKHLNRLRRLARQAGDVQHAPVLHRGQRGHLRLDEGTKQRIRQAIADHQRNNGSADDPPGGSDG